MTFDSEGYERWQINMCCEDRYCSKCGTWYADADPNERRCECCEFCPEGECDMRHPGYCDHDWQSYETPSQSFLRRRAA